jgi:hypothetical protein
LLSLIGDGIDTHRERAVREAPDPLAQIADRTEAVLLGIAHFNKSAGTDISARITGSGAFKNVPRAIFGFGRDLEAAEGVCVLTQSKNSLGRSNLPSVRYRIESAEIQTLKGAAVTGRFVPLGVSERSVEDILAASSNGATPSPVTEKLTEQQEFILMYVEAYGDERGEVPSRDVITQSEKEGYTQRDLVKARLSIGDRVQTRKVGKEGGWNWFLADRKEAAGSAASAA